MKNIIVILGLLFLLIGCKKDAVPECVTFIVQNRTPYDLTLDFYKENEIDTVLDIEENREKEITSSCDDFSLYQFLNEYDSIVVVLENEIVRTYTRSDTSRTIYHSHLWVETEKDDGYCTRYQIIEEDLNL